MLSRVILMFSIGNDAFCDLRALSLRVRAFTRHRFFGVGRHGPAILYLKKPMFFLFLIFSRKSKLVHLKIFTLVIFLLIYTVQA